MLCDKCKGKPATVHVVENVNGERSEMHLCEDCAAAMNIKTEFHLMNPADFLNGFFEPFGVGQLQQDRVCAKCGTRFSDFSRTGYVGCADCYAQFREELTPVIRRMHGKAQHVGKIPKGRDRQEAAKREYERLNAELKQAIASENYEEAAKLRDKIKKLGNNR